MVNPMDLSNYNPIYHKETPFILTYGEEAAISVELGEPNPRILLGTSGHHESMDLIDEIRDTAKLANQALKKRVTKKYNTKVRPRGFHAGDLMLRQVDARILGTRGKLALNWKGPFRVKEVLGKELLS
ncbi:uncharacterized protein [Arachis hypogaea]|uniref:uncharacterized protein n=1 Tax=Arachis hypogaea TaxID=3818 RepID=UPI003B223A9D